MDHPLGSQLEGKTGEDIQALGVDRWWRYSTEESVRLLLIIRDGMQIIIIDIIKLDGIT